MNYTYFEMFSIIRDREPISSGNVVAVDLEKIGGIPDGYFGLYYKDAIFAEVGQPPNSPVTKGDMLISVIRSHGLRVSKKRAKRVHPKLFDFIRELQI